MTLRNVILRAFLAFAIVGALATEPLSAQLVKGSISGTVTDSTGAVISTAQVVATNTATGQVASTTTDSSGLFKLALLPVGNYTLKVSKTGFRTTAVGAVTVAAGADTGEGTIRLEVGGTSETVEVSAATPLVESTQAQVSDTFSTTQLQNIPGVQENEGLDNLALLLPGVSASRDLGYSNSNGVDFAVNGIRGRNNDQQIDGQNNNDNSVGGPGVFMSDPYWVDNYQVTTDNFGPEYGRNSGSVINVVTKSGTNTWHGDFYGTESNATLDSLTNVQKQFEGLTKVPHFNEEFSGITMGGPIVKNKVFVFGGFDNDLEPSGTIYSSGLLTPTPTGLTQMASCYTSAASQQSLAALNAFGPYGVKGGNPTPSGTPQTVLLSGIDPATVDPTTGMGSFFPGFVSNDPSGECAVEMAGVQRSLSNSFHGYGAIGRVDVVGDKNTFSGRYIWQKQTFLNFDEGQAAQGYPISVPSVGQQGYLSWTRKISDRMLNELRVNYGRVNVQFGTNSLNTVPSQSDLTNALTNVGFADTTLLGYGPGTSFPQGRIVNTYQLQDNWTFVSGRNQLKAGVNFTYQRSPNHFLPDSNGSYVFDDWNAYAGNEPDYVNIAEGNPLLDFREKDTFLYFGDDLKATSHLTLNLGITWSYYGQPANLFHKNDVAQQTSSNPFWNPNLPLSITTYPEIPAPKNSWGPSIGFAWNPSGGWLLGENKTVIRGGYRLAYDPPFYNIYLNMATYAPQALATTAVSPGPMPGDPTGPNVRTALAAYLPFGVQDPRSVSQTSITPNFGPDRVHSWSLGIQRELGAHAAAEVRYVGNHGENLFQSIDGNPYIQGLADGIAAGVFNPSVLPAGVTPCPAADAVVPSATGRVNCNEGKVRERTNTAYSNYNALQAEFRTNNLFNQLTLKTNYTFSKTLSNADEIFGTFSGGGTYAFSQNPLDYEGQEYGISGLDFPHSWTLSFYENLPFFRAQHGIIGHILGGWNLAGSYILQSGQPYTPVQFYFNTFAGGFNTTDTSFDETFNGSYETLRPFQGNASAPVTSIGVYAGDACGFWGGPACAAAPDTLLDFTALNQSGGATANTVTNSQVHFIANGPEADSIYGTPWGTAARNSLRDYSTNTANFQIGKNFKIGERVNLNWHVSFINVFNHFNFDSVDPILEDAGDNAEEDGFGIPSLFDTNGGSTSGNRVIRFGLRASF
jgi:Carboxypeptidase regulatory-like domain